MESRLFRFGGLPIALIFYASFCYAMTDVCWASDAARPRDNADRLVIGSGEITGENLALARERAISDALMLGFEAYLCETLGPNGVVENFKRLTEEVVPKAREAIENFHILTEQKVAGRYRMLVRIKVNEKVVAEKLRSAGIVATEEPLLRVLFLVSESENGVARYWWKDARSQSVLTATDLALHKSFQGAFSPVNRTLGVDEKECPDAMRSIALREEDVAAWGRLFDADLVIYGSSRITDGEEVSMVLEAYDVSEEKALCRRMWVDRIQETEGVKDPTSKCIEETARRLASELSGCIDRNAVRGGQATNRLKLDLKGLKDYRSFKRFKEFLLRDVSAVKGVKQTGISSDSVSLMVEFSGGRDAFLKQLLDSEALPFPVKITGEASDEVSLSFF